MKYKQLLLQKLNTLLNSVTIVDSMVSGNYRKEEIKDRIATIKEFIQEIESLLQKEN